MIKLLAVFFLFSTLSLAQTTCEQRVSEIVNEYNQNGKKVESFKIKDCSNSDQDMSVPFNTNRDTNAPKVYTTSACVILLKHSNSPVKEVLVIDEENDFELLRNFDNQNRETIGHSRSGNAQTGTISFMVKEGDYIDSSGFLNDIDYITRVDYNQKTDQARLLKWKLNFFSNKYSHDYTVQCK